MRKPLKEKEFSINGLFKDRVRIISRGQSAYLSVASITTVQTILSQRDKTDPTNYSSARIIQAII